MSDKQICIGCGSSQLMAVNELLKCKACGLLFANRGVTLDYTSVYTEDTGVYQNHYKALDHFQTTARLMRVLLPFEEKIISIVRSRQDIKLFVDLGCGVGRFLRALQISGQSAIGYELSQQLVDRLSGHGRDVRQGAVDEFLAHGQTADAISMLEVIEHVPHPGDMVARILREKRPKLMFVVVPDWSVRRKFDPQFALHDVPPNHLSWWSAQSLQCLMEHEGYSTSVTAVHEKRRSLVGNFLRNPNRMSFKACFTLLQALFNPPTFWLLGVATRNED